MKNDDYEARCEFEEFLFKIGKKYNLPDECLYQLMNLFSNWIMFKEERDIYNDKIEEISKSLSM